MDTESKLSHRETDDAAADRPASLSASVKEIRSVDPTGTHPSHSASATEPSDCAEIVQDYMDPEEKHKYQDLLLTPEQQEKITRKIDTYYQLKRNAEKQMGDGVGYCIWCNKSYQLPANSSSSSSSSIQKEGQFQSFYDTKTFCKTLKIVCPASPACRSADKEWRLTYGVVFNLEELVRSHQKKIEALKHEIIVNKNDLMFGYKEREDALAYHDTKLAQLKAILDTYSIRLFNYLSYANNEKLNKDVDKLHREIRRWVAEMKAFVKNANMSDAVKTSLEIKKEQVCVRQLQAIQQHAYQEYLFNCESQFVLEEDKVLNEKVKRSQEKKVLERRRMEKEREQAKETGEHILEDKKEKKQQKKREAIDKEIKHLYDSYELFDELLRDDAEHYETTQREIDNLSKVLKHYGTEEQKKEFAEIRTLFVDKFVALENAKMEKEKAEKDKIENMLQGGENDDVLKQAMEQEMEVLE